ncbi:predicted protein [Nematostella vectensis]|uniref:Agenet-like domain-containing protein n=1 Tax=Nematostella vectensis TaxID=45351 RepID=A7SM36_NEMVE|nr:predicted protein [Nematostella vectensis]|eukprot:XP_001627317.1 predicted protein [Nematostella vectensis]
MGLWISSSQSLTPTCLSSLSGYGFMDIGLPPASPSERDIDLKDDKSTLFLIACYARYNCPYVWVYTRADDNEPCGWWLAKIIHKKGEFFVIQYSGWDATFNEIVPRERIRPPNTNGSISRQMYYKLAKKQMGILERLKLPEHLMGLAIGAQGANIQQARKLPGVMSIEVDEENCTFNICGEEVEQMKREKESLDHQLQNMGISPPTGPSYIPTPAEMRIGTNLMVAPPDSTGSTGRDRALTTDSYGGDLSEGMSISTDPGTTARPSTIRIRSSSESDNTESGRLNSQNANRRAPTPTSELTDIREEGEEHGAHKGSSGEPVKDQRKKPSPWFMSNRKRSNSEGKDDKPNGDGRQHQHNGRSNQRPDQRSWNQGKAQARHSQQSNRSNKSSSNGTQMRSNSGSLSQNWRKQEGLKERSGSDETEAKPSEVAAEETVAEEKVNSEEKSSVESAEQAGKGTEKKSCDQPEAADAPISAEG